MSSIQESSAVNGITSFRVVDEDSRNVDGEKELVVAVMGITGSGKSTFIQKITGKNVKIGHKLQSCTAKVTAVRLVRGANVTLLDTPGFNDTNRSDTDVLRDISEYLSVTYKQGFHLSGVIYLHPISATRMEGSSLRSLRMFRKLVGDRALKNVILATTHWDRVQGNEGTQRENELCEFFWKRLLDHGAQIVRHKGDEHSGLQILDTLLSKNSVVLDIQREMVDEGKKLIDTAAGHALNEELNNLKSKYERELQETRDEMRIAIAERDRSAQEEIKEVRQQLELQMARAEQNQRQLLEGQRRAELSKEQLALEIRKLKKSHKSLEIAKRNQDKSSEGSESDSESGFFATMRKVLLFGGAVTVAMFFEYMNREDEDSGEE